jgi:hypothetical protein
VVVAVAADETRLRDMSERRPAACTTIVLG